jgi:hypothetical protein
VNWYADDPTETPVWRWASKDSAPTLPIPEWMTRSPEEIYIEALAEADERKRKEEEAKASSTITDEDIPF